jgi:hypothetical protein
MLDPDRIEAYERYTAAQRAAVVETLARNVELSERTGQDSGAVWGRVLIQVAHVEEPMPEIPNFFVLPNDTPATVAPLLPSRGELSPFEELKERAAELDEIPDLVTHALKQARSFDDLLDVARDLLSPEIAERLTELRDAPIDQKEGEHPLRIESVRQFLDYCVRRAVIERPRMAVTPNGELEGTWIGGGERRLVLRFFSNGLVWLAINAPECRGSLELKASHLLTEKCTIRIPEWA